MTLSKDGSLLIVTRNGSTETSPATPPGIMLINPITIQLIATIAPDLGGDAESVAISPDSKTAYVFSNNGKAGNSEVLTIDVPSQSIIGRTPVTLSSAGLLLSPDGELLFIGPNFSAYVMDTFTGNVTQMPLQSANSTSAWAINRTGTQLFVSTFDGAVVTYDTGSRTMIRKAPVHPNANIDAISVSRSNRSLFVHDENAASYTVMDINTGAISQELPSIKGVGSIAAAP